jgi:hypothetical protein
VVQAQFEEARSDQLARIVRLQATTKERALRIEGEQERFQPKLRLRILNVYDAKTRRKRSSKEEMRRVRNQ